MKYKAITLKRKEILYDVNFISWKTAKCRVVEPEAQAEAQHDDESHEWFERQLASAVDRIKGQLRWCIREHMGTIVDNTIKDKAIAYGDDGYPATPQDAASFNDDAAFLDAPAEIHVPLPEHTFRFAFSDTWRGSLEALANHIHRHVVDYILYEWFRMTLPSEASSYLASSELWMDKIINEARSEDVRNVYFRL